MLSSQVLPISIARRAETEQPGASALGLRTKENRPERAADRQMLFPKIPLVERTRFGRPFSIVNPRAGVFRQRRHGMCRLMRAITLRVSFPGLKPWAVLCSPFGRLRYPCENALAWLPHLQWNHPPSHKIGARAVPDELPWPASIT